MQETKQQVIINNLQLQKEHSTIEYEIEISCDGKITFHHPTKEIAPLMLDIDPSLKNRILLPGLSEEQLHIALTLCG